MPCTPQTIKVDTTVETEYRYRLLIETQLTKTTWANYLYHFSNEIKNPYRISVRYGEWEEGVSKTSAPEELFPADEPETMIKTFLLDDGENGEVNYWFYPFYTGYNRSPDKLT